LPANEDACAWAHAPKRPAAHRTAVRWRRHAQRRHVVTREAARLRRRAVEVSREGHGDRRHAIRVDQLVVPAVWGRARHITSASRAVSPVLLRADASWRAAGPVRGLAAVPGCTVCVLYTQM
jgi:hypothetical protein